MLAFALACARDPHPSPVPTTTTPTPTPSTGDTAGTTTPTTPTAPSPALVFTGARPRHVLMLSIDTTRRDQFGKFSVTGTNYTPFLDSLATDGVEAADVQQCSDWTFASTSCTLNGRYPETDGFLPTLTLPSTDPANQLPDGQRTLAVRLKEAGWYTILDSANGWLSTDDNNAQGYDEVGRPSPHDATSLLTDAVTRLQAAIDGGHDQWLLHVHFIEPHPPYIPPDAYLTEEAKLPPLPPDMDLTTQDGQYDADDQWPALDAAGQALLEAHLWARYHGELRYLDDQVAAFWPQLESAGLLDDTLVVVWTDHGEQFWEHGHQSHAYYLAAEENDGVQFYWARDLQPRQWTGPAHAVDLVPTVLDAVGLPADPDDPTLDGEVLGLAPADRARFSLSWARQGLEQAVTVDGWKLMFDWGGEMALYDRTTDRYELVDRIADPDQRTRVQDLWAALAPRIVLAHAIEPDQVPAWPEGLPH